MLFQRRNVRQFQNSRRDKASVVGTEKERGQTPLHCLYTAKPYVSVFCSWNTARNNAGLKDVRMHDLRHSFASFLVNAGRSLYEVQKLLGHTQIKTTQRYAHLSQDSLLSAANVVSQLVPLAMVIAATAAVNMERLALSA